MSGGPDRGAELAGEVLVEHAPDLARDDRVRLGGALGAGGLEVERAARRRSTARRKSRRNAIAFAKALGASGEP